MIYCAQFMMKEVRGHVQEKRWHPVHVVLSNAYLPGMFRGRAFGRFAMRL